MGTMSDNTDAVFVHLRHILSGIEELKAGQHEQGVRLRKSETAIAVLRWAVGLIGAVSLAAAMVVLPLVVKYLWP